MATANTPSFDLVDSTLRQLGATGGAPEAHGSLCGLACFPGTVWVASLVESGAGTSSPDQEDTSVLGALAEVTYASLFEGDMSFSPLLPPDDRPLAARAEGLAEWCAGFMHGLGEAAGDRSASEALSSEVSQEIMEDFGEIARVRLGDDETDLEAETAYADLVEFVRVSVQLMFEELYSVRQGFSATSVH
jgi:uncharacterized protein YgfB (UPF0149 family)